MISSAAEDSKENQKVAKPSSKLPEFKSKLNSKTSAVHLEGNGQSSSTISGLEHQAVLGKRKGELMDQDLLAADPSKDDNLGEGILRKTIAKASIKKPVSQPLNRAPTKKTSSVIKPLTVPVSSRSTRATVSSNSKKTAAVSAPSKTSSRSTVASSAPKSSITRSKPTPATAAVDAATVQPPTKKKRKEYDVKGRLQDLEEQHNHTTSQLTESTKLIETMTEKLDMSQSTISELMQFKFTLESTVQAKEHEKSMMEKELQNIASVKEDLIKSHEIEMKLVKAKHDSVVEKITSDLESLRKEMGNLKIELDGSRAECAQYKVTISTQSANQYVLESEIGLLKSKLNSIESLAEDRAKSICELESAKTGLEIIVDELEAKIRDHESMRRSLHNTIQELKGNIRVFCRMRPLLEDEKDDGAETGLSQIKFPENEEGAIELVQYGDSASGKQLLKPYNFTFDKVFQPTTNQAVVFDELSQLVQSALDGYNVCIFAYGQTGSGKTFTMEGPGHVSGPADPNAGMIPRAVQQIYSACESLKEKGWEYNMQAQFLEIYNETLRDLLDNGNDTKKLDIKHDAKNRTTVTDAINVDVTSPDEVFTLLAKATQNRAVAATNCNERSSRSHSVFTLKLSAGSERLSISGATGDRLKETQAINKSLSSLGDVISALANKESHIPYRNSKLTYLLQHSLGGNSKTLMFVNISPLASSFNETLCSLRFATKVNSCQIGTARKQIKI